MVSLISCLISSFFINCGGNTIAMYEEQYDKTSFERATIVNFNDNINISNLDITWNNDNLYFELDTYSYVDIYYLPNTSSENMFFTGSKFITSTFSYPSSNEQLRSLLNLLPDNDLLKYLYGLKISFSNISSAYSYDNVNNFFTFNNSVNVSFNLFFGWYNSSNVFQHQAISLDNVVYVNSSVDSSCYSTEDVSLIKQYVFNNNLYQDYYHFEYQWNNPESGDTSSDKTYYINVDLKNLLEEASFFSIEKYNVAYENGKTSGYKDGYNKGYNDGISGKNINPFLIAFDGIKGCFDIEIFPNFKIGYAVGFGMFCLLIRFVLGFFH
mgnify:CR=1 FL=1